MPSWSGRDIFKWKNVIRMPSFNIVTISFVRKAEAVSWIAWFNKCILSLILSRRHKHQCYVKAPQTRKKLHLHDCNEKLNQSREIPCLYIFFSSPPASKLFESFEKFPINFSNERNFSSASSSRGKNLIRFQFPQLKSVFSIDVKLYGKHMSSVK